MKPWFYNEQSITEFKEPVVYKGLNISVSKTKVKPPYIAVVTSPATGKEVMKTGGNTEQEALDSAKQAVDKREADAPNISAGGQTSLLFNTPSNDELLKDPTIYNDIYAKISKDSNGPTLVIGNELYGAADLAADGFRRSDRRNPKKATTDALPQVAVNASNKLLSQMGIKMNGRYTMDIEGKYRDENEHTVYPLQFQSSTIHAGDKERMNRPGLTIGTTREDIQPWFQREVEEAEIIKFPEPEKKVLDMPSVASYPDFMTGVSDLKARMGKGEISQASHDKLYTDLIHRFMKKESFETPWFLREAPDNRNVKRLNFVTNYLKNNPEELARFHKVIAQKEREQKLASGSTDAVDLAKKLQPAFTKPESDQAPLIKTLIKNMVQADGDDDDMINFVNNYGKVSYINTEALMKQGERVPIKAWLSGAGKVSDAFIFSLFKSLFPKDAYGGPGETAMALLSPSITRPDGNKGDLVINKLNVEVKGEASKGGGRLKDEALSIGTPNIEPIYAQVKQKRPNINLPDYTRISTSSTGREVKTAKGQKFQLLNVAKAIDAVDPTLADKFMKEMLTGAFKKVAGAYGTLFKNWRGMDFKSMTYAAAKMSYLNYKSELDAKNFNHILMLNLPKAVSLFYSTDDFDKVSNLFGIGSVDFGDKINSGAVQVSL
jgi:hypothetical protein